MIEARHLTKRYGQTVAVDVTPAPSPSGPCRVTGFLRARTATSKPDHAEEDTSST